MIGKPFAHCEITALLGQGGMGEVYCARDTKLNRDVVIKILPAEAARSPERRARFPREASAIAALKHPNIVTRDSVQEEGGVHCITMELVEGETLAAGATVDHRSDIFSLGIVLYQVATGTQPFQGPTFASPTSGISAAPPWQTVVQFPGSGAIHSRSSEDISPRRVDDLETREDIDGGRLAFMGVSWGGRRWGRS